METKKWYKSKTVWSGVATMVLGALASLGIATEGADPEAVAQHIVGGIIAINGLVTIISRIVANTQIEKE